jgi:hypothetical protein
VNVGNLASTDLEVARGRNLRENHLRAEFMQFLARYGRSYASKSDFDVRYEIFADNYAAIEEHNSNPEATHTKGVNQFTDMSEQELQERLGKTALRKPA